MSVRKIKLSTNISIATILIQLLILLHSQTIQVVHCNAATSKSDANHKQLQQKANNNQTTIISSSSSNNNNNSNGLDEILRDTFQSLDFLNQKLDQVDNKTRNNESTILMREMRALDEDEADNKAQQIEASAADGGTPASLLASNYRLKDEELTQLAQGFSSERRLASSGAASDPLASSATSNNEQRSFVLPPPSAAAAAVAASKPADGIVGSTPVLSEPLAGAAAASKRARQLNPEDDLRMLASGSSGSKFDNEFTEKHIRFTLDMMRAIFSSQSYTTKTNSLDSFLISPVSVQLVLMMMHLGARGQTKRELSNALHFLSSSPTLSTPTTTTPATAAATNHSSVQHHEFMLGSLSNQNGANLSSGGGGSSSSNLLIKNAKLTRRHHQPVNNKQALQNQRQQQNQVSPLALNNNVHEQFGAAMRQLLKDSTVVRALTSANQIFVQKDLPLSPQYEWAVKHYYGADLKQVDFQNQSFDQHPQSQQQQQQQQPKSNGNLTNSNSNSNSGNSTQQLASGANIQQAINEWVERQTRGKISNFLSAPVPTSTLLMALNVLFYKGDWQYKFDPADTDPDAWFTQTDGKTVKVPMMVNKLPLAHAHDPIMKTSVIELPYKAQRLGLFILLPDEVNGIFDTMSMLNSSSFANLISMMRKTAPTSGSGNSGSGSSGGSSGSGVSNSVAPSDGGGINVRIPKFSIESSPRLSQILSQQLGLKTLFSPDVADLSGMFANPLQTAQKRSNQSLSVSGTDNGTQQAARTVQPSPPQVGLDELLHKAVLQVHEQGSVAAAASATIVERVGLFNGQYFEADHPFLLFLMDKQTGLVLFSGAFAGPTGLDASSRNPHLSSPSPIGEKNLTASTTQGADNHPGRNSKATPT